MAIFAFYGLQGSPSVDADGILSLPPLVDAYGNDCVGAHMETVGADLLVTLIDPFVLDPSIFGPLNWCAWAPIDGSPILPQNVTALRGAKWIWAMSRFGERELKKAGFNNVFYVPHGVDTKVYHPINRTEARARLGHFLNTDLTGKYLVAYNAANTGTPPRKGFHECFAAFKRFSDMHPEAMLYLHSEQLGRRGVHMPSIMEQVGLDPAKVIFAPQYKYLSGMLPAAYLNDVYNAADVYFHPSHGEGFGIPILEAQAAGCPVIVSESSAMIELAACGYTCTTHPFMDIPGRLWQIPDIRELTRTLGYVYGLPEHMQTELREKAHKFAQDYDVQVVMDQYMLPAMRSIQADIDDHKSATAPISIKAKF